MGDPAFSLDHKYTVEAGTILLSGVQALVRLPLDQHRADRRAGLRTATLVSGYRGSPVGGYDAALWAAQRHLDAHEVRFIPAVNEELAATAIFGAETANLLPDPKFDGVLGIWYGKGPGVDRSGDAFKHANLIGVGRYGGVLAIAGDDPGAKSSTVPSASEVALYDAQMPVLYPGNVQEVLDLGLLGFALSRYSGLWVGCKLATDVADEFSSAVVGPDRLQVTRPTFEYRGRPWEHRQSAQLLVPHNLELEREMADGRLEAARHFGAVNGLNRIAVAAPRAWLGVAAAGKTYYDVREALRKLGLSDADLNRYGIRLLKVGMLYPLDPAIVHEFAAGLERVIVIEEKRSFLEMFIRDILYAGSHRPAMLGKTDEQGRALVPSYGELDADLIAGLLLEQLRHRLPAEALRRPIVPADHVGGDPGPPRVPYFCSGCPHNRSTVVPEGSRAVAGIGCHSMAIAMDERATGYTQMGGEGAQWVGAAPFTGLPHLFQNMGDGTFFHSGSLALRQAVAARATVTFKLLYNGAVAMTGGQPVDGGIAVPALTHELVAEGVQRIVVVADEPAGYRGAALAAGVTVHSRDDLDSVQRTLREVPGVSVLIYDQHCAADLRRKRRRGQAPVRSMRVLINEAVCEGCGDCGVKSNCLSVQPVATEFGRKTQIHQSSCNTDYSCLDGDCPSFVTIEPGPTLPTRPALPPLPDLPEPVRTVGAEANLYCMGIGGTGVVTANQILATAALLEGKRVRSLDQTGMSQKGGAVVSHLRISTDDHDGANRVGRGEADGYLAFDVLTAADSKHLERARPDRTVAVVSMSEVPTGPMVRTGTVVFPDPDGLAARIDAATRSDRNVFLDAGALADRWFGSHIQANLIVVGAAYQAGVIPLAAQSIERAIELNGAGSGENLAAFRIGRAVAADPAWGTSLAGPRSGAWAAPVTNAALGKELIAPIEAGELRRLLERRVPDLIAYQDLAYAQTYAAFVLTVRDHERRLGPAGDGRLAEAVARQLFKLMAYKDEYEVARLTLDPAFRDVVRREFGAEAAVSYRLHPPLLRAFGLRRKLRLGSWFDPVLKGLRSLRGLRGTWFDPFGYHPIRRLERALIGEYRTLIETELARLTPESYERTVTLAGLPDLIRGYENVKLANVTRYRQAVAALLADGPVHLNPRESHEVGIQ